MNELRTILKYPGAKWRIADWIVNLMPEHKSYLEPYFGSGAALFRKPPSRIETINDLDGDVVNIFRCIRERGDELARAVALTPYSREEYENAFEHSGVTDPVERARLFLLQHWQGHGFRTYCRSGWKNDIAGREYGYAVRYWDRLPAWVADTVERLKEVQIEQMPAVDLIRRFRRPDVLIYADPPYLLSTRKMKKQYRFEMSDSDHVELLAALKDHPGPVMLSGYDSALYNDTLSGWQKLQTAARAEKGLRRTETLWVNYEIQMRLEG